MIASIPEKILAVWLVGITTAHSQEFETVKTQDTGAALVNSAMGWTMHFYSNIPTNYGSKLSPADTLTRTGSQTDMHRIDFMIRWHWEPAAMAIPDPDRLVPQVCMPCAAAIQHISELRQHGLDNSPRLTGLWLYHQKKPFRR